MAVRIVSLHVYPVKSLRGIDQGVAELTPLGLAHDRAWLVIDGAGRFLSQREAPEMARIATELHDDRLVLRREGMEDCAVPLSGVSGARRETKVWDDRCEVEDQGQEAARWLAGALDTDLELRLVRMAAGFRREERRRDRYGEGVSLFFADTAPFLVANTGSLDRLNEALATAGRSPVGMDRFRANVVVDGLEAFGEQDLEALDGPGYRLALRYPRERCVVTTLDQATGAKDPHGEPFRTLRRINPMPDVPGPAGPAFGMLSVLASGAGQRIRVGDELSPVTRAAGSSPP